jgi:hypothetical protein
MTLVRIGALPQLYALFFQARWDEMAFAESPV